MNLDELIESSIKISGINNKITKEESVSLVKRDINKLFDIIKTYSDVCKELKEPEYCIDDFDFLPKEYQSKLYNTLKLQQIAKLFNNGWIPNLTDSKEKKWFPYYQNTGMVGSSKWRFDYSYCTYHNSADVVVCYYQTKEISSFVGKIFQNIYIEYIESI